MNKKKAQQAGVSDKQDREANLAMGIEKPEIVFGPQNTQSEATVEKEMTVEQSTGPYTKKRLNRMVAALEGKEVIDEESEEKSKIPPKVHKNLEVRSKRLNLNLKDKTAWMPFRGHVRRALKRFNLLKKNFGSEYDERAEDAMEDYCCRQMRLIKDLDSRDEMTQLYGRDAYLKQNIERLKHSEGMENANVTYFMLDADFFKSFNEALTHVAGDVMIQTISQSLMETAKEIRSMMVARLGGEELGGRIDNVRGGARQAIEEIRREIGQAGNKLLDDIEREYQKAGIELEPGGARKLLFDVLTKDRAAELNEVIPRDNPEKYSKIQERVEGLGLAKGKVEDLEPCEVYALLDNAIKAAPESPQAEQLMEIRKDLIGCVSLGTVTCGYVEVDVSSARSQISESDRSYIYRALNAQPPFLETLYFKDLFEDETSQKGKLSKGITYYEFKNTIEGEIAAIERDIEISSDDPEKNDLRVKAMQLERLLNSVYARRVGRMMDLAREAAEQQKGIKRNTTGCFMNRVVTLAEVDADKLKTRARQKHHNKHEKPEEKVEANLSKAMQKKIREKHHELSRQLQVFKDERNKKGFDRRLRFLDKFVGLIKRSVKKEEQKEKGGEKVPEWFKMDPLVSATRNELLDAQAVRFSEDLTQCPNSRYMDVQSQRELLGALSHDRDYNLAFMDADYLKWVNESWGSNHDLGDIFLQTLALNANIEFSKVAEERGTNLSQFIRLTGGEECAATIPDLKSAEAAEVMNKVIDKTSQDFEEFVGSIEVSLGDKEQAELAAFFEREGVADKDMNKVTLLDTIKYAICKNQDVKWDDIKRIGTVTAVVLNSQELNQEEFFENKDKRDLEIGIMARWGDKLTGKVKRFGKRGEALNLEGVEALIPG